MPAPWLKPARTVRSRGNAALRLAIEQRGDLAPRLGDVADVGAAAPEAGDVVPGRHDVALVDRHRPRRRVREHEADPGHAEVGDDRLEVVAVGAQAVKPEHGRGRAGGARLDLDARQQVGVGQRVALPLASRRAGGRRRRPAYRSRPRPAAPRAPGSRSPAAARRAAGSSARSGCCGCAGPCRAGRSRRLR